MQFFRLTKLSDRGTIYTVCFSRTMAFHYQLSVIQIWSSERESIFSCILGFMFVCQRKATLATLHVI